MAHPFVQVNPSNGIIESLIERFDYCLGGIPLRSETKTMALVYLVVSAPAVADMVDWMEFLKILEDEFHIHIPDEWDDKVPLTIGELADNLFNLVMEYTE